MDNGLLNSLLGIGLGLITLLAVDRVKALTDKKRGDTEALKIYDAIEADNARRTRDEINRLTIDNRRMRALLIHYKHDPDESAPLGKLHK